MGGGGGYISKCTAYNLFVNFVRRRFDRLLGKG